MTFFGELVMINLLFKEWSLLKQEEDYLDTVGTDRFMLKSYHESRPKLHQSCTRMTIINEFHIFTRWMS